MPHRDPTALAPRPKHATKQTLAADLAAPRWLKVTFAALERVAPRGGGVLAASLFTTPRRHRTPDWERALRASSRQVTFAGELNAAEFGPADGAPVVLLHGWEGRGTQLGRLGEPLIAAGHRVIALDGPAHGGSKGKRANPIAFAEALLAVQREVGAFHAVIAHSIGAASTGIAIRRGLRVRRVALLGGPASLPEVLDRFIRVVGIEPRVARHLRAVLREQTGSHPDEVDVRLSGPHMTVPALVIHDVRDAEVPVSDGHVVAAFWRGARLIEVDVGGHRRMLKSPEVIDAVTRFVTGFDRP